MLANPWLRRLVAACCAALPMLATGAPWFDAGRPTAAAHEAVQVLTAAGEQGLDPREYAAQALGARVAQASQGALPDGEEVRRLEDALTAALQRYLRDLQHGRVDPRQLGAAFDAPRRPDVDLAAVLRSVAAGQPLAVAARAAEPPLPVYARLRRALARYRSLDEAPWQSRLPPLPGRKLLPGHAYAGAGMLARRLAALGDLPPDAGAPQRYDGELVSAVRDFQERHGLTPDGVLGAATLQALEVSPAARARQIELALERLRWTPLLRGERMIVVNVPEFVLRAYEVSEGRIDVRLTMKVIVGKALGMRTPLLGEDMRFVEFSPFWNVPASIVRQELVPRMRRDPASFAREGFEFVTRSGQVVTTLAPEHLDAALRGTWRIRQRPGPRNALGSIKFVFPNNANVYLHDTPSPRLFERERRDFSHGCIRVQAPVALAAFVLQGERGWTEERVRAAMDKGESSTVRLSRPLPVLIAYSTVVAHGAAVHFHADVYGQDRLLHEALRRRSALLPPLPGLAP